MASLFRARRSDEPRSGGKLLRGRRVTPSPSPYARPRPESPPESPQIGSPRWLSGLISGAGKLISSVLPSRRSSESPSQSASDYDDSSDGDDSDDLGEIQPLSQERNELPLGKDINGLLTMIRKSDTKIAIEHLLMQETFSRDECERLTKLIRSRVVDLPSPNICRDGTVKLRSRTAGNGVLLGASLSFSQNWNLPERVPYAFSKGHALSPRSSLFEACTPDICNKAVSEAKKWIEEKKLASKQKYDSECGPCTLNTDMLHYDTESEGGSPVDMAKSYMRSLPPWRSPSFSGVGFKTPPPSRMHRYKNETLYENSNNYMHSSKDLKRNRLFDGSWDTHDETARLRLRSTDDKLDGANSKQIDFSATMSEHESFGNLLGAENRGNIHLLSGVSEQVEMIDAVHSTHCISGSSTHPLEPTQSVDGNQDEHPMEKPDNASVPPDTLASASNLVGNNGHLSSEIMLIPTTSDDNQILQTTEVVGNVSVPSDTLASASRLSEHDGNPLSEIKATPKENRKPALQSVAGNVADLNDVETSNIHTSSGVEGTTRSDGSSEQNHVSAVAVTSYISDSGSQDGNSHKDKKANGATNEVSVNGSTAEVKTNISHETLNNVSDSIVPQNGTRMKSIERMLAEPQAPTRAATGRRGKKVVVKSRRGRKS